MRIAPLLIAFMFALVVNGKSQAQSVFPIKITDQGHILVKAKINGVQGDFLLDTAGGLTAITQDFASQIAGLVKLDGGYTAFRATGERLDLNLYGGNNVGMGGISLQNSALTIIDADWPVDGIISLMSFRNQPFTIDFENKKLYLESPKSLAKRKMNGKVIPLQLEDSRGKALDVFTYITVNDSLTLQTSLDSGAGYGAFRISSRYMSELGIDLAETKKSYRKSRYNQGEGNQFFKATLDKMALLNLPDVNIKDFQVTFVKGLIYDAIVPIKWLGDQITIDIAHKEMVVR